MASNHYDTLKVNPSASQAEIKQAYRRLVKQFHPDTNQEADHDQIVRINAAYEVLGMLKVGSPTTSNLVIIE